MYTRTRPARPLTSQSIDAESGQPMAVGGSIFGECGAFECRSIITGAVERLASEPEPPRHSSFVFERTC